jgi:hypothetical protein
MPAIKECDSAAQHSTKRDLSTVSDNIRAKGLMVLGPACTGLYMQVLYAIPKL